MIEMAGNINQKCRRSNRQLLKRKKALSSGSSFLSSRKSRTTFFKKITGNHKRFARNKKSIKNIEEVYLLHLQICYAPLGIIQCVKFGACAIGWPTLL